MGDDALSNKQQSLQFPFRVVLYSFRTETHFGCYGLDRASSF